VSELYWRDFNALALRLSMQMIPAEGAMASKNLLPNFREPGLVNREHDSLITQLRAELHTGFQALSMQLASLQAAPPSAPQGEGVDNVHELSPAPDGMIDKRSSKYMMNTQKRAASRRT
jgi:hypothetical protein